jgi:hypothetical protein
MMAIGYRRLPLLLAMRVPVATTFAAILNARRVEKRSRMTFCINSNSLLQVEQRQKRLHCVKFDATTMPDRVGLWRAKTCTMSRRISIDIPPDRPVYYVFRVQIAKMPCPVSNDTSVMRKKSGTCFALERCKSATAKSCCLVALVFVVAPKTVTLYVVRCTNFDTYTHTHTHTHTHAPSFTTRWSIFFSISTFDCWEFVLRSPLV